MYNFSPLVSLFEVVVDSCWLFCTWDAANSVDMCDLNIHVDIWDTGSNLVMSELFIVVICYVVVCLIAAISLLYSSIIYIYLYDVPALFVDCIMLMGCIYLLQCWNGSVIRGPVCAVLPMAFSVVCDDMCPCLHVHLATVMTAVVLLLKTFISLRTYYYYYFHVLLSWIASPPLFLWL